jgi:hypothetical protein
MLDTKFVCRTSTAADTWRVSTPLVFPQLPDNVDDPSLYQNALQAHRAAPLAVLAGDDQQLQVRSRGTWRFGCSGLLGGCVEVWMVLLLANTVPTKVAVHRAASPDSAGRS